MTPPDLTPEQVIAEALNDCDCEVCIREAAPILAALRAAGIPVGWEDVRERLTSEGAVDAAAGTGLGRPFNVARGIEAAISHAEEAR